MGAGRLAKVTTPEATDVFLYQVPAGKFFIGKVTFYNDDDNARDVSLHAVDAADTGGRDDRYILHKVNVSPKGTFTLSGLILAQQQKLYVTQHFTNVQTTAHVIGFERDDT